MSRRRGVWRPARAADHLPQRQVGGGGRVRARARASAAGGARRPRAGAGCGSSDNSLAPACTRPRSRPGAPRSPGSGPLSGVVLTRRSSRALARTKFWRARYCVSGLGAVGRRLRLGLLAVVLQSVPRAGSGRQYASVAREKKASAVPRNSHLPGGPSGSGRGEPSGQASHGSRSHADGGGQYHFPVHAQDSVVVEVGVEGDRRSYGTPRGSAAGRDPRRERVPRALPGGPPKSSRP